MRMRGTSEGLHCIISDILILIDTSDPLFLVAEGSYFTYFQVMIMLSLIEPVVFILTVIIWGCDENKSFVSQFFCPSMTDLAKLRTSTA